MTDNPTMRNCAGPYSMSEKPEASFKGIRFRRSSSAENPNSFRAIQRWKGWGEIWGIEVVPIEGDSGDGRIVELVRSYGPYDFIFIDGDHSYDAVRKYWLNYGPMVADGGIVVFHDILPHVRLPSVEVWRLWAELKETGSMIRRER
jgi:hypothetical protein